MTCSPYEAARWYQAAAGQGDVESQWATGQMYLTGRGVSQSDIEALKWLRLAADRGEADAQLDLARMYKDGKGAPQDYVKAHMGANLAASRGPDRAPWRPLTPDGRSKTRRYYTELRDELAALMTPEQVAEAQVLARNWRPTEPSDGRGSRAPEDCAAPGTEREVFVGTGFAVNRRGDVVTNHHVVDGCTQIAVFGSAGQQKVEIIAEDGQNDLAVVGPIKQAVASLTLGGDRPKLGQSAIVVGFPLHGILASSLNVTTGSVSALAGLEDDTRMIQITAPVQPGNSGGPLLDQTGAVMGVVSSKLDVLRTAELTGDLPQNVNFAIRASTLRAFLDANGIEYATHPGGTSLDTVSVAEQAKKAVVRIECYK